MIHLKWSRSEETDRRKRQRRNLPTTLSETVENDPKRPRPAFDDLELLPRSPRVEPWRVVSRLLGMTDDIVLNRPRLGTTGPHLSDWPNVMRIVKCSSAQIQRRRVVSLSVLGVKPRVAFTA